MTYVPFGSRAASILGLPWSSSCLFTNFIYHHMAREFNLLLNKVVFNFLAVLFRATYWWVYPCTSPTFQKCVSGKAYIFCFPYVLWSCSNGTVSIICSFVIWSIETKFKISPFTIGVLINFKFNFFVIMANNKRIGLCFPSAMWVSIKVSYKMGCTSSDFHNVKSLHIPVSHIIKPHATPPRLFQAAHPFQTAHWWTYPLYALASPNSLVSFGLIKECVGFLSTYETFVPFIWSPRHKRLGLALRLLALATMSSSNIQSVIQTWFGLVYIANF